MSETTIDRIQAWLNRLQAGDARARDELINIAYGRLLRLARKMLNDYPRLRQWEESADVSQNALVRLRRSLETVSPQSPREFFALAAAQIRRELRDMARHYYGRNKPAKVSSPSPRRIPERSPANLVMHGKGGGNDGLAEPEAAERTNEPGCLAIWSEFHRQVDNLPPIDKEITDLLLYQELTQEEAAEVLGVDKSTVKRRWRSARVKLHGFLEGWLAES
jgi:RNA polymerase sigma factor (sigma-70 family)